MTRERTRRNAVVVGGTQGIGKEVVRALANQGRDVILTGRSLDGARDVAAQVGPNVTGLSLDLSLPHTIADSLSEVGPVDDLVISAIERDANTLDNYDVAAAIRLVTLKLVGYTEVIHSLRSRLSANCSIVLFGGLALERPYPGSTTVSTVNGGVVGMVHSLACELAPVRINAIHPGIIGDSPYWEEKDNSHIISRTPLGRLVTMEEIVHSVLFLLENTGVNGVNLAMDGGWLRK